MHKIEWRLTWLPWCRSKQAPLTEQTHTIVTQLLTLQNGRIDDFENRLANAENAAIPSHETPEQVRLRRYWSWPWALRKALRPLMAWITVAGKVLLCGRDELPTSGDQGAEGLPAGLITAPFLPSVSQSCQHLP